MGTDRQYMVPSRVEGLVSRDLGDEVVVLNPKTQQAHRLQAEHARVWRLAGAGLTASAELAPYAQSLQKMGLLQRSNAGLSRRTVLRGAGIAAGAAVALPVIDSFTLPAAANCASVLPAGGTTVAQAFFDSESNSFANPSDGYTFVSSGTATVAGTAPNQTLNISTLAAFTAAQSVTTPGPRFTLDGTNNNIRHVGYNDNLANSGTKPVHIGVGAKNVAGFYYTVTGPAGSSENVQYTWSFSTTDANIEFFVGTGTTTISQAASSGTTNACLTVGTKIYFLAYDVASNDNGDVTVTSVSVQQSTGL